MGDFHAPMNFYSHKDSVNAFCKLQGHQIYEECCELDLYFASEDIWRCKPYIPRHMLDYRPPKAMETHHRVIYRNSTTTRKVQNKLPKIQKRHGQSPPRAACGES